MRVLENVVQTWCIVPYMVIFTKYDNKIIPNAHWEWPLGIEFLQWVFQPHSGRNSDLTLLVEDAEGVDMLMSSVYRPENT